MQRRRALFQDMNRCLCGSSGLLPAHRPTAKIPHYFVIPEFSIKDCAAVSYIFCAGTSAAMEHVPALVTWVSRAILTFASGLRQVSSLLRK